MYFLEHLSQGNCNCVFFFRSEDAGLSTGESTKVDKFGVPRFETYPDSFLLQGFSEYRFGENCQSHMWSCKRKAYCVRLETI